MFRSQNYIKVFVVASEKLPDNILFNGGVMRLIILTGL